MTLRIVQAQLNFRVGDIAYNLQKHRDAIKKALELKADAILFSELSLTGYPPEDLLLRPEFIKETQHSLEELAKETPDIYCIVGHPLLIESWLYNACSVLLNGKIITQYQKQCLPNYGVFDEARYFSPGKSTCLFSLRDIPTSIIICEDLWKLEPSEKAKHKGAKLLLVPNASPFEINKHEKRFEIITKRAKKHKFSIIYVNQITGQDELVFDGGSMVVNAKGELCHLAKHCEEELSVIDIDVNGNISAQKTITPPQTLTRIYNVLTLGLRDYVQKNHFKSVIIGVSGGIDSALTLALAVDALGKENVYALVMPSRYTASISLEDAEILIKNLDVKSETLSIEPTYQAMLETLKTSFAHTKSDVTEENIQARIRGMLLMSLSNKFGSLVLTTGNRSEIAVGYCTLYGDMVGGYAVLKNIPKTLVYALSHYRNQISSVIPERILTRAPTAELAPNQTDQDVLPPYDILDAILEAYINQSKSSQEIIDKGFDAATVNRVIKMIKGSEYKRKQSAIGPHVDNKSFIKDWRYPVTNGYKG